MDAVINRPAVRVTQVRRWLGSAIAVSFALSSATAHADEPPVPPPAPAVVAPTPAVKAPTSAASSSSPPDKEQPPRARRRLPPRVRDTTVLKPDVLPAKEDEAAPAGYHDEERIRTGSVVSGSLLFGIPYLISVIVGGQGVRDGNRPSAALLFPVTGPFVMTGYVKGSGHGFDVLAIDFVLLADGLMQVGGVAQIMVGLLAKRRVFVLDEVNKSSVMPVPMSFGANSAGVGVIGTF